ncbi:MAG: non-ribosomal peptide synthetase, partial [bacterium]|nr:non-ribosomal peptide synthetase [bacterium]
MNEDISEKELQEFLSGKLPEYMVPAYFVQMETLPLTSNGKIDKKALPAPLLESTEHYVAPGSHLEEKMVEVWEKVLENNKIGIKDNFFAIGGDSIKAIQVAARMTKLGYGINMSDIFGNPTIDALAPLTKKVNK